MVTIWISFSLQSNTTEAAEKQQVIANASVDFINIERTVIWVNIDSVMCVIWRHQAITWTNGDILSVRDINLSVIS